MDSSHVNSPKGRRSGLQALVVGGTATLLVLLTGCAGGPTLKSASADQLEVQGAGPLYHIGPGDTLNIFVWQNPELSVSVPVRPDGRVNTPLVEDLQAAGKTPTRLARDFEQALSRYVKNPVVTVMLSGFVGQAAEQIRVVGEAAEPQAIPYSEGMTVLDVMIAVGGLTEFAAGDRAKLIRSVGGKQRRYSVRLDDLLRDGDISANVSMLPGDIVIIPEAWF